MVTNHTNVRRFEEEVVELLGVKHAVAVSSCTSGLLLVWKAMGLNQGEVVLPSFTFSASGHSLLWNNLTPRFVDIEQDTLLPSPEAVEAAITPNTVGILAVHVFGNPAYPDRLEEIASRRGLRLVFDSAHALGGAYRGRPIGGFGDAEVFSLSPTKLVVAAEGGIVATGDDELARRVRIGRDYGNPGNYDTEFEGLSARMSEFHAILGSETLGSLSENFRRRYRLVDLYLGRLGELPGLRFQRIVPHGESTYKDLAVLVDPEGFGLTRDQLVVALKAEGVTTRSYYDPPLHRQRAYAAYRADHAGRLPVTEAVASQVVCLPLASHYTEELIEGICAAVANIHEHRAEVAKAVA
jgi:dTDP-4-amino-4,6-dideoxygalactose transaminase